MLIDASGHLDNALFISSPNFDERPSGCHISLLVIHCISLPPDEFDGDGVIRLFTNQLDPAAHPYYSSIQSLKVSAHFFIRRDGMIIQFVSCNKRAWHAGESCWQGRTRCNDFSIGIELEGTDDSAFEDNQYQQLAKLVDALSSSYPNINKNRLTGHSDIAPGRKTDPGTGFNWDKLRKLLT